jgi:hypothetical protein
MATEVLEQHLTICTTYRAKLRGNLSERDIKQKRCRGYRAALSTKEKNLALCRWAFTRMNERFHKCERNKVSTHACVHTHKPMEMNAHFCPCRNLGFGRLRMCHPSVRACLQSESCCQTG